MPDRIKKLIKRFKPEIAYLIVGGVTTLISLSVYYLLNVFCELNYIVAHFISWIIAVAFAYFANRKWVFISKNKISSRKRHCLLCQDSFHSYSKLCFSFFVLRSF